MSSFRFASPVIVPELALEQGQIHVQPNAQDLGLDPSGWDESFVYGFYGTQSKLLGLSAAFQVAVEKAGKFIAIDWELQAANPPLTLEQWQASGGIASTALGPDAINSLLSNQHPVLVLKNIKSEKGHAIRALWLAAAKVVYGAQELKRIDDLHTVNIDDILSLCSAYPLAVTELFRAIPGLSCVVFPRFIGGKEYWVGCLPRHKISEISLLSARGHSKLAITMS